MAGWRSSDGARWRRASRTNDFTGENRRKKKLRERGVVAFPVGLTDLDSFTTSASLFGVTTVEPSRRQEQPCHRLEAAVTRSRRRRHLNLSLLQIMDPRRPRRRVITQRKKTSSSGNQHFTAGLRIRSKQQGQQLQQEEKPQPGEEDSTIQEKV